MYKKILLTISLGLMSAYSYSADYQRLENEEKIATAIRSAVDVPGTNVKTFSLNGDIWFVTTNGRLLISPTNGSIYDLWHKQNIRTVEEMEILGKIYPQKMKFNFETVSSLVIGTGNKKVYLFVDPGNSATTVLYKQANELSSKYTFVFVVVPGRNTDQKISSATLCANETQLKEAFNNYTFNKLPQKDTKYCAADKLPAILGVASILNLNILPQIITPNGDTHKTWPLNLSEILGESR
jgi:hypothetical protein